MSDYVFSPALTRAGIADYVDLFNIAFAGDSKLSAQYLDWLYVQNPHGRVIGFDAFSDGELAAHYAIMPRRYILDGNAYAAALSINTATHPSHQGRGLFTRLAEVTYAHAAEQGVRFVVGAANANSVGGFIRKLGFHNLGQIRLYFGLAAPAAAADELTLAADIPWLRWRLANPSRRYTALALSGGDWSISTKVNRLPFHLGRVGAAEDALDVDPQALPIPGLSPVFSRSPPKGPRLPLGFQPSPWHVIWKDLADGLSGDLRSALRMDGLSMDTF